MPYPPRYGKSAGDQRAWRINHSGDSVRDGRHPAFRRREGDSETERAGAGCMQFREAQGTDQDRSPRTQAAEVLAVPGGHVGRIAQRCVPTTPRVLHDEGCKPAEKDAVPDRNRMQAPAHHLHHSHERRQLRSRQDAERYCPSGSRRVSGMTVEKKRCSRKVRKFSLRG